MTSVSTMANAGLRRSETTALTRCQITRAEDGSGRMTSNQTPAATVMRQGRWSSVRMVTKYTRHLATAEALEYL